MAIRSRKTRRAVTLVELVVVVVIVGILMFAVGTVLVDSQNSWNTMYKRSYSGPTVDGLLAVKEFDRAVRKATVQQWSIDGVALAMTGTTSLQVYYYKNPATSTNFDGYSKFYYVSNSKILKVDEGDLTAGTFTPAGVTATRTIAQNVQSCVFRAQAAPATAVEMILRLDSGQSPNTDIKDGNIQMTVSSSAVRHN